MVVTFDLKEIFTLLLWHNAMLQRKCVNPHLAENPTSCDQLILSEIEFDQIQFGKHTRWKSSAINVVLISS